MRKVTLIRGARQLLTLRGPSGPRRGTDLRNLGIIEDGAVLIADGVILEVGPTRRLENLALARGAEEIDVSGSVVLPGFVDSHVHVVRVAAQEQSPRALRTMALRVLDEAVPCGTTALEVKSGQALTEAAKLKILRVQAALGELPLTLVSTFLAEGGAAVFGERLLPAVRRRKLAQFAEMGRQAEACRFLTLARELGLGVKVGDGAIAMAAELGATAVDDVLDATERDAMLLSQSQTVATLSAVAGFDARDRRYAPARMLIEHGAAVALASGRDTDSPNMQMTVALACRAMHLTPAEAIAAATINGAHAMRRAGSIGSIEAGKSADLIVLGLADYRELPYHFGVNLANLVMIRGRVLAQKSEVQWPAR